MRIIGYDLARALAVFGMVVVNFKVVMGAEQNGPSWLIHLVGLFDGRAAATFVVLAGAGISLLTRKGFAAKDHGLLRKNRNALLKRALFLFVVGLLYTPLWPADILHFYGIYIGIAALLLATPKHYLWSLSGTLIIVFAVLLLFVLDYDNGWNWETLDYIGFWTVSGMIRHLFFNGFHPVIPWLAFLLIGMILGRKDMRQKKVRQRVFAWGIAVALFAEVTSWLVIQMLSPGTSLVELEEIQIIFGTSPMPPMPLYMLAGAGTACAVIALMIGFGEKYREAAWVRPFVSTGQLALTLYVAHVVIGMGFLETIGRLENQTLSFAVITSLLFFMLSVVFAHYWRLRFERGPLELVMRKITQ